MAQPSWIAPELATLTRDRFSDPAWITERKFDGERCLAFVENGEVQLRTRNKKLITGTYPELAAALAGQDAGDFIVDGEIVAFDGAATSFERLQQRMQLAAPLPKLVQQVPVFFYLFDMVYSGGRDLRRLPLTKRKEYLGQLSLRDPLRLATHRTGEGEAHYADACRQGWEGVIAKRAGSVYRAGRSKDWLKFKCENAQEFVVGGYTDPQGSRTGFGALLLGYYDPDGRLVYAGKVGTGFTTRTLTSLLAALRALGQDGTAFDQGDLPHSGVHWVRPELVAQIGFAEWTMAGQLRHPRYQGLRDDKEPREVVRERPQPSTD
jgi:bifunctional non-homologous end joining protein LigD